MFGAASPGADGESRGILPQIGKCKWDSAVQLTERSWKEIILRDANLPLSTPSVHTVHILSQSAPALSSRELLKKEFHSVLDGITPDESTKATAFLRSLLGERTAQAVREAKVRGGLSGGMVAPPGSKGGKRRSQGAALGGGGN